MRTSLGINVISYFISESNNISKLDQSAFKEMYGIDAKFIQPDNVVDIAKTINAKFLEIAN